jgi:alcohol dehydrogenase (cytochrome c)
MGSYDPELNTVYWGIGNPGLFNSAVRPGDNLYTCAVLALDPKTGKIKWHYFSLRRTTRSTMISVAEMGAG